MQFSLRGWRAVCAAVVVLAIAGAGSVSAQDLASFEKRLTVHTLPNGYTFLILERPGAPVFSFATRVDVGSAQEVPGITGLAHMFEHMAFKGTPRLGTKDFAKEKVALDELEAAYQAYERARAAVKPDQAEVDRLLKAFKDKEAAAQEFVIANAFDEALSRAGGVGLNASTSAEATTYYYSLPTNKFELFAYLESERFIHPVFREFYKERDVVMEERRQRTESQPIGKLIERMLATAFLAHPYKQPTVGYMSDLQRFTLTDAEAFFKKYYVPANMVTAIVGNVKAAEIIPILDKYFGRLPKGEKPAPLRTLEPPQSAELTITLREKSQPIYIEGYHKPSALHPDDAVYDAIAEILGRGRTSRLYTSLVEKQKLAVQAQVGGGLPGVKYPAPVRGAGSAGPRHQQRQGRRGAARRTLAHGDRGCDRRRTRAVQDAGQGRPHPVARQQQRPGRTTGDLPHTDGRLARHLQVHRADRCREQGRYPPRRGGRVQGDQPYGGPARERRGTCRRRHAMSRLRTGVALATFVLGGLAAAVADAQVATVDQLKYPALPAFSLPRPTRTVLPNGLVVLVMEDHELPLVSVSARFRTGSLARAGRQDRRGEPDRLADASGRHGRHSRPRRSTAISRGAPPPSSRASATTPDRRA